jgi:hypothetical protein
LSCESHIQWRAHDGKLAIRDTRIGRQRMPEITRCRAADAVDEVSVPCVIAGETPSAMAGCRRCEMYQAVEAQYSAQMSQPGQTWILTEAQAEMNENDEQIDRVCRDCRARWQITVAEMEWFVQKKGLNVPKRCPECRRIRREATQQIERHN